MKLKYIMFVGVLFLTFAATAQEKYSLNYLIAFPTGDAADFTPSTSFRGIGFDYTHMMDDQFGIGVSGGWQTFYDDRGEQTTTDGTESITANRYNYINSVPLYATGSYFINEDNDFTPFLSLGVGVMYNRKEQDFGLFKSELDAWQFSLRPELGFEYKINYGIGIRTAVRYNYAFESGDLEGLSHIAIAVGLVWDN